MTPACRPAVGRSLLPPRQHAAVVEALSRDAVRRLGWRKAARWVGYVLWLAEHEGDAGNVARVWRATRRADLEPGGSLAPHLRAGVAALRAFAGHAAGDPHVWMVRLWPVIKTLV